MRKILFFSIIFVFIATIFAGDMDLYYSYMAKKGISRAEAKKLFDKMPQEEKILVLSAIKAKTNDDLDDLPPLKHEYQKLNAVTDTVNIMDKIFDNTSRTMDYSVNGWYGNERVNLNLRRGKTVEKITFDIDASEARNTLIRLYINGIMVASRRILGYETVTFYVNRVVNASYGNYFDISTNNIVRIDNVDIEYAYDGYNGYYDDDYYGYDLIKKVVLSSRRKVRIPVNKTVSSLLFASDKGIYLYNVQVQTDSRTLNYRVNKDLYDGEYKLRLRRKYFVKYIIADAEAYERDVLRVYADVNGYNGGDNGYYEPAPSYGYMNINTYKVSSPYQAESVYSGYRKIDKNSSLGQKIVLELKDRLQQNNYDNQNREVLRALVRGNYVIRQVNRNDYMVIWW